MSAFHLINFILCIFLIQNWKREHSVYPVTRIWLFRETKKEISNVLTITILKKPQKNPNKPNQNLLTLDLESSFEIKNYN